MAPGTSIAVVLGKTALFGSLAPADRLLVAGQMRRTGFSQGQTIFARGDPGGDVYLVVEGCVRLSVFSSDGRALSFKHANAGDIFGEIASLDGGVRTADAIALTRVEAMALARTRLNSLIETNPLGSRKLWWESSGNLFHAFTALGRSRMRKLTINTPATMRSVPSSMRASTCSPRKRTPRINPTTGKA